MSEGILKALMQLFAIIAKVEVNEDGQGFKLDKGGRAIVISFLKNELNPNLAKIYLSLFDEHLAIHQGQSNQDSLKRTSVNSVKVLRICTRINEELTQRQKVVVLIRILEFILANELVTSQEYEFVETVADTFNINKEEFEVCLEFVGASSNDKIDSSDYLIVSKDRTPQYDLFSKHIYSENMSGFLRILKINSVSAYFVRYYGTHQLYLNGQLIHSDRIHILKRGSSIRSSKIKPIYYSDIIGRFLSDASFKNIVFSIDNIEYRFNRGEVGLHSFTATEESGKIVGIMGGSGAGKSTLLNVLNGNYAPSQGSVTINGLDIHKDKNQLEGVIGFVPQDDLLIEELTVFQNFFYNAKLCFGNYKDTQIVKLVLKLLDVIGLAEVKDLKVGSPLENLISGGQRKRLNIALELIREPAVLFVDEPTSGLSSRDSENIMDLLKELALKGKLIFVVIHQPSSEIFKMFDKLMILDLGGYPIYHGDPIDAIVYFKRLVNQGNAEESECIACGNVNPEQIFNIIESKVVDEYGNLTPNRKILPEQWNAYYREENSKADVFTPEYSEIPDTIFKAPGKLKQLGIFFKRDVLSKLTNGQYMIITLFEAPLLALILGFFMKYMVNYSTNGNAEYIFYESQNLPQYLFISVIVALFIGLTTSSEEIIGNLKILKRERFLNLSRSSYLFAKIAIMFMISAIQTFSYVVMGNWILEIQGMHATYWLVIFSTSCFANVLGLNISASFNSVKVIYILIPILIIPQLLFSGIIVQFDKLHPVFASKSHVPFIGNIMASRWAYEALAVSQFKDNKFEKNFYYYDKYMSFSNWKKDQWISNIETKLKAGLRYVNETDPIVLKEKEKDVTRKLYIAKRELKKELDQIKSLDCGGPKGICNAIKKVSIDKFDVDSYDTIIGYLYSVKQGYMDLYITFEKQKDSAVRAFTNPSIGFINTLDTKVNNSEINEEEHKMLRKFMNKLKYASFQNFRNTYKNKALEEFVTNANSLIFTDEDDESIIQKKDPVYLDPYQFDNFKAHFYAPNKKIFGLSIDTLYANTIVIWLMTMLLSITLFFDFLKKIMNTIGKLASLISRLLKRNKFQTKTLEI